MQFLLVTCYAWVYDPALYEAGPVGVCKCYCPEHTVAQGTHWTDAAMATQPLTACLSGSTSISCLVNPNSASLPCLESLGSPAELTPVEIPH